LPGDLAEPDLYLVEPGGVGRGEVTVEARSTGKPSTDLGVLVADVVVEDQVNVQLLGYVGLDMAQKGQEVLVPMAALALGQWRVSEGLESGIVGINTGLMSTDRPQPEMAERPGKSFFQVATSRVDPERVIFSKYHAAGSNTAAFMVRKGRWKFHYYVRFRPELFDLEADPEELNDLAPDPSYGEVLRDMEAELRRICDPEAGDERAKRDQMALIERVGGPDVAATMGSGGATPAPKVY
jgi:hypothetical protein